uniref:RS1_2 n=1 Tax=Human herpesvirus 2 TaxID=10310 RepID=A0A481TBE7_HHV2|nr:RS1_2 [Human alphaherpesvirus 2]
MGWLQNPRVAPGDVALDQACFRISGAARNSSSFISGSVARAVPHLGYAMAAGRFGWGLAHVAAAVAMSRRYDRAQKGFLLTSLRRAYAPLLARENAALTGARTPDDGGDANRHDGDAARGKPAAGAAAAPLPSAAASPADERAVPAGYGAAGVLAALGRLSAAPASAPAGADDDDDDDAAPAVVAAAGARRRAAWPWSAWPPAAGSWRRWRRASTATWRPCRGWPEPGPPRPRARGPRARPPRRTPTRPACAPGCASCGSCATRWC